MEFTCSVCEFKYNEMTGDVDERICNECMDKEVDDFVESVTEQRKPIDVFSDGLTAMGLSDKQIVRVLDLILQYNKSKFSL